MGLSSVSYTHLFNELNKRFDNNDIKFNELKRDINEIKIKCVSNFNELKYELDEKLSHSLKSMNNRVDEIESSMVEKIDKQIQEVTENFECKINECNAVSEYKFNCVVDKIETYETSTNVKINEIESNCKTEIQAIQNTVNTIDKNNKQFECLNNDKFVLMEQSIVNVKDELNVAINKKLSSVTEQIVITKDMNSDIDLELFNCENGGYTLCSCLLYTSRCV